MMGIMDKELFDLISDDARWQIVLQRDAHFDGRFFYGVRSTGVFCRPSCPSRRPRRDQVLFFDTWQAAETAGFRPCKRCQPKEAGALRGAWVAQACRLIEEAGGALTLHELAAQLNVSMFHLQRTFKAVVGVTPHQYGAAYRMQRFKQHVRSGDKVVDAVYESGFGSSSRLYESVNGRLGMTPTYYRRGGAGMNIQFTIVDCTLGRMLVAATERGICSVGLGDEDDVLKDALHKEYPAAAISADSTLLGEWTKTLRHFLDVRHPYLDGRHPDLDGKHPILDLPLDVQATAFQARVWEELRRIPYGEVRTYTQVAEAIGQPKAVRAVANACAHNPTALITPCHRVVRSDGAAGGYRWGIERKQQLLQREKNASKVSQ